MGHRPFVLHPSPLARAHLDFPCRAGVHCPFPLYNTRMHAHTPTRAHTQCTHTHAHTRTFYQPSAPSFCVRLGIRQAGCPVDMVHWKGLCLPSTTTDTVAGLSRVVTFAVPGTSVEPHGALISPRQLSALAECDTARLEWPPTWTQTPEPRRS
jgi:hypothetical protein